VTARFFFGTKRKPELDNFNKLWLNRAITAQRVKDVRNRVLRN